MVSFWYKLEATKTHHNARSGTLDRIWTGFVELKLHRSSAQALDKFLPN